MILGTVELGLDYGINNDSGMPSDIQAMKVLDLAWTGGIREVDTAFSYGKSERILGDYKKNTGNSFLIDTKLSTDFSLDHLKSNFGISLDRLQTNNLNVLYLHSFEQLEDKEIISYIRDLKRSKIIKNIGISIYEPYELSFIMDGLDWVDVVQIPFNILDNGRWKENNLLFNATKKGIAIYARSVFLQGLIFREPTDQLVLNKNATEYIKNIRKVCENEQCKIDQLAYNYVASNKEISQIIIGCQNEVDIKKNLDLVKNYSAISQENMYLIEETAKNIDMEIIDPRRWNRT